MRYVDEFGYACDDNTAAQMPRRDTTPAPPPAPSVERDAVKRAVFRAGIVGPGFYDRLVHSLRSEGFEISNETQRRDTTSSPPPAIPVVELCPSFVGRSGVQHASVRVNGKCVWHFPEPFASQKAKKLADALGVVLTLPPPPQHAAALRAVTRAELGSWDPVRGGPGQRLSEALETEGWRFVGKDGAK